MTNPATPSTPAASSAYLSSETRQKLEQSYARRQKLLNRYRYYHQETIEFLNRHTTSDSHVLWMGLHAIERAKGLKYAELSILEIDSAPAETPDPSSRIHVLSAIQDLERQKPIDFVVLPYTLQLFDDIQRFLQELHPYLSPHTRVFFIQYNFFWAPVIKLAQLLRLKNPMPDLNWLNIQDITNFFLVTGYQEITSGYRCLMPIGIPLLTRFMNRYLSPLPWIRALGQKTYVIARAIQPKETPSAPTVSVVVPARNEAGNIHALLDRLPVLGSSCEVLFVEGHSKDSTWETIQHEIAVHERRTQFTLKAFQQTGNGKADAVRLGFSKATGDILMILDADLTVQPEDLNNFYTALLGGQAEFLNGSRLIYQMDAHAMQFLNLFFNKAFASLISWLIGQRIKDSLCGTKALYRKDYLNIRDHFAQLSRMDPFGDFELLLGSSKLSLKISDIMVRYKSRTYGRTNIQRFRHGWQLLRLCLTSWSEMK